MDSDSLDEWMMRRCFDVAKQAVARGELPFGSIVAKDGELIGVAGNSVRGDRDIMRHAEAVAMAAAQKRLGRTSLEGCTLYTNIEPCAFCSYAIREARIAKVVYGLSSPVMGGDSRWNILGDEQLSSRMPEVFSPPPRIRREFLADEADAAFLATSPLVWAGTRSRSLFVRSGDALLRPAPARASGLRLAFDAVMNVLRRQFFDRFSRGTA